jgi:hypothetical protein
MIVGDDLAQRLVDHPTKGLTVELQRWLDPTKPDALAKIVIGRGAKPTTTGKMPGRESETVLGPPERPQRCWCEQTSS